jgi:hypothetical protein
VKRKPLVRRCTLARLLALGVVIALMPLPVAAGEPNQAAASPHRIASSVQKVVASLPQPAPAKTAWQAREQQAGGPELSSPSFFKRPIGIAVIAVVGAGTAYAIYSASHDRIHSQAR